MKEIYVCYVNKKKLSLQKKKKKQKEGEEIKTKQDVEPIEAEIVVLNLSSDWRRGGSIFNAHASVTGRETNFQA